MLLTDPLDIEIFKNAKKNAQLETQLKLNHAVRVLLGLRVKRCCPECGSEAYFGLRQIEEFCNDYLDGHDEVEDRYIEWLGWSCHDCDYEDM